MGYQWGRMISLVKVRRRIRSLHGKWKKGRASDGEEERTGAGKGV